MCGEKLTDAGILWRFIGRMWNGESLTYTMYVTLCLTESDIQWF